ncbi:MAG: threonine aldolase family protein [Phycisphaerales bacterium]
MPSTLPFIDLRSDTVTRPTQPMRDAMARAQVGDDVLGDDPTVRSLEQRTAELFGKEAALFVPSGTMANQIALRCHTEPGDEIICHRKSHCYYYESGAPAALLGLMFTLLDGHRGQFDPDDLDAAIRPDDEHYPRSRVLVLENTMNKAGGTVWSVDRFAAIADRARQRGLAVHLDGARIWNAVAANKADLRDYARHTDTISCCFSKGLGAPVGSAVVADAGTIRRARRFRKMFGGAMRQSGILAAAALHALEHHRDRLADDARHARTLGQILAERTDLPIDLDAIETNMVFFEGRLAGRAVGAVEFCRRMARDDVRVGLVEMDRQSVRATCHLDVTEEQVREAAERIARAVRSG